MKRLGIVVSSAAAWVMVLASQALAQYPPSKPPPSTAPTDPNGGVAFTGASISLGVIILISLVVVGALLLLAGRRRRAGALQ